MLSLGWRGLILGLSWKIPFVGFLVCLKISKTGRIVPGKLWNEIPLALLFLRLVWAAELWFPVFPRSLPGLHRWGS